MRTLEPSRVRTSVFQVPLLDLLLAYVLLSVVLTVAVALIPVTLQQLPLRKSPRLLHWLSERK